MQEFSNSKKQGGGNNKRQIDLLFSRLRNRLAIKGPKAFLNAFRILKSLDLDSDGFLTFYEFKKAVRDCRFEVTDYELDMMFTSLSGESNVVNLFEFYSLVQGFMNEGRQELVFRAFQKIDTDNDGLVNVTDIGIAFCARVHPDVKSGKKQVTEDSILKELIDSLEMYKSLEGSIGDQVFTKQEFFEFFSHYSAAIEEDLMFEAIIVNCFKLTQESKMENSYAGIAGGYKVHGQTRLPYETFHKASYLQDHHKQLYYGGTVTSNAPFGTFEEKTNYSTTLRPKDTNESTVDKAAGAPTSLLKDLQTSSVYSAEDAFNSLSSKIHARGINGLLQFKRALLSQGVQFMDIETYMDFLKNIRIDLPKNLLFKIFGTFKDEQKDKIDSVILWKKLLGPINQARNQEVYSVFDAIDTDKDGFILFEELKCLLFLFNLSKIQSFKAS